MGGITPGSTAMIGGRTHWLMGYAETDSEPGFWFSPVDPAEDYEAAVAAKVFVCGSHAEQETTDEQI